MKPTLEKPPVKKPSGIIETRAQAFAAEMAENCRKYGPQDFHVEWKKSRMYGRNPVIHHDGGKCTDISGCGYDKLSACLSSALHWLFPEPVNLGSGAGVRKVIDNLKERGWILDHTVSGKDLDVFTLAVAPDVEEKPDPPPVRGSGLPSDPDGMNDERAGWAGAAVKGFLKAHKGEAHPQTVLADLLCDLHHWADRNGADFDAALRVSVGHYEAETDGTQDEE